MQTTKPFIEVMAKHLPPSASTLRLLDIGHAVEAVFASLREDIDVIVGSLHQSDWKLDTDNVDAVTLFDYFPDNATFERILDVMRVGGRMILVLPHGKVSEDYVHHLESLGYVRILVEPAIDGQGVLIRGEKRHTTSDTIERVQTIATQDNDNIDLANYRGRYIYTLVQQTPNKPVWRLAPDEKIEWQALTIERESQTTLLVFSSLPKAVSFMQPAVVEGLIHSINKVGKFKKEVAQTWEYNVWLNPTLDDVCDYTFDTLTLDPDTAEAPDE